VATWNVADAPDHLPFALPVGAGFLRRLLPARRSQNRHQKHVCFVGVLARTANVQTALGLCQWWFVSERAPKSYVRRDRCISTR